MINSNELLIAQFQKELEEGYSKTYGSWCKEYKGIIGWAGREFGDLMATNCDSPYHNLDHIVDVSMVGQEILLGKHKMNRVFPNEWLNFMIACITHDIGYAKNLFKEDKDDLTSAALTAEHVDRSKRFVAKRFKNHKIINAKKIADLIEYTRFPQITKQLNKKGKKFGMLIAAADFIGQLANVHYSNKQVSLFYEFQEIGANKKFGYKNAEDIKKNFPTFFLKFIHPKIFDAIYYLDKTEEGKRMVTSLYGNVKRAELIS